MLYFNDVLDAIVTLNVIREETMQHLNEIDLNRSLRTETLSSSSKEHHSGFNSIQYSSRDEKSNPDKEC